VVTNSNTGILPQN